MLDAKARDKITGASRRFERSCYAVQVHGDGTARRGTRMMTI